MTAHYFSWFCEFYSILDALTSLGRWRDWHVGANDLQAEIIDPNRAASQQHAKLSR
jgi:hypothetical protein